MWNSTSKHVAAFLSYLHTRTLLAVTFFICHSLARSLTYSFTRSIFHILDRSEAMASQKEFSKDETNAITIVRASSDHGIDIAPGNDGEKAEEELKRPMATKRALIAWLVLCFSTGPTSGMAFRYVPAVLQSGANVLGHIPGTNKPCAKRGVIRCVVPFGTGEVDYNSYM
jgi:hypothetical protein